MVKLWNRAVDTSNALNDLRWNCYYLWLDAFWLWQFRFGRPRLQIRVGGVEPSTGRWHEHAVGWVRFQAEAEALLAMVRETQPLYIDRYELHSQDGLCRFQGPLRPPTVPTGWQTLEAWGWLHEYETWFQVPLGTAWRTSHTDLRVHWTNRVRRVLVRCLGRRGARV